MNGLLLLTLAIAPSIAFLIYIYNRDRYDKEPRRLLFRAFILGIVIVVPTVVVELILAAMYRGGGMLGPAFYHGFVVAGFTEEVLKFIALYLGFFKVREFNERFDGIVYGVFVSLGFATLENILYVTTGGVGVALTRALTAVPAHALFGVAMGYYVGRARFADPSRVRNLLAKAILVPILLHGLYDFILMSQNMILLILFIPYMIYMWRRGMKNLKELDQVKDQLLQINYETHQYSEPIPEGQSIEEHMVFEHPEYGPEDEIFSEDQQEEC